jgi:hypothetical protein
VAAGIDHDAVELVDTAVMQRRVDLVVLHARLGGEERIGPADRHAVGRQREVVGTMIFTRSGSIEIDAELSTVSETHLKPTQQPEVAAHRPAVQAEIDDLLHRRRIQHRHHGGRELVIGLVRDRGGLGGVVVAGQHEHTAVLRCPAKLPCLNTSPQRSTPGPFPYHMANTPSTLAPWYIVTCCEPQIAVAARSSFRPGWNVMSARFQELFGLPQRLVEAAQAASRVAGHEPGGVEPGGRSRWRCSISRRTSA